VRQELPAVLLADDAKSLVHQMLARRWAARDRLTIRLPPSRMGLEPGTIVQPAVASGSWIADRASIDAFVTVLELRPNWKSAIKLAGEAGRIVANEDVVEAATSLALIDVPNLAEAQTGGPTILIAASSASRGWSARPISVDVSGQTFATQTATRKSILGSAITVLGDATPYLIDEINQVEVELIDQQQWLTSCDDEALSDGVNLAVLGTEILQFAAVTPLGQGRFRLARLLRGRGATEGAAGSHSIGECFCLLDVNSLQRLELPAWAIGSTMTASDRNGSVSSLQFSGGSVRPLSPASLTAVVAATGDLILSWTRRSRLGFAWVDEIDAPIGEGREQYRTTITGVSASLEVMSDTPGVVVPASELATVGGGNVVIQVRQLGDWGASRPAQTTINLQ